MLQENPKLIHKYGIRYFIGGDLNNPGLRSLMLRARNHLEEAKRHNTFDLQELYLEKPNEYTAESRYGVDTVRINMPEVGEEEKRKLELKRKEEKQEVTEEYLFAVEAYTSIDVEYTETLTSYYKKKIGYILCESGTFDGPYKLILTDNIIRADLGYHLDNEGSDIHKFDRLIDAREAGITVDPFEFPMWKYEYSYDYGDGYDTFEAPWRLLDAIYPGIEADPETGMMMEKEIATEYESYGGRAVEIKYTDIPCRMDELIIANDWEYLEKTGDTAALSGEQQHINCQGPGSPYWCSTWWWWWLTYEGSGTFHTPISNILMTFPEWKYWYPEYESYGYKYALEIPGTAYEYDAVEQIFSGETPGGSDYAGPWTCTHLDDPPCADCTDSRLWPKQESDYMVPWFASNPFDITWNPETTDPIGGPSDCRGAFTWEERSILDFWSQEDNWGIARDLSTYCMLKEYFSFTQSQLYGATADEGFPYCDGVQAYIASFTDLDYIITDYGHQSKHQLEIAGKQGVETFDIVGPFGEANGDYAYDQSFGDCHCRYYELSDDIYWVAVLIDLHTTGGVDNFYRYYVFKSEGQGDSRLSYTEFPYTEKGYPARPDFEGNSDTYKVLHLIEELSYSDPDTGDPLPVYMGGEFRLFRVEKTTKFDDVEITQEIEF